MDYHACAKALGFQTLAAVRAAEAGATIPELKQLVEKSRAHIGVFFTIETLEFLHRDGRTGGAQRFFGSTLNLKPILVLHDGRIEAEDCVRTKYKAMERVLELIVKEVQGKSNIRLATVHANAEAEATQLLDQAARAVGSVEAIVAP